MFRLKMRVKLGKLTNAIGKPHQWVSWIKNLKGLRLFREGATAVVASENGKMSDVIVTHTMSLRYQND